MKRIGYGQVEPNHLSAQRTGQIYAQLPSAIDVLENGMFAKYDMENGQVNLTGDGEWLLVLNEVKLYDNLKESYKDFAMVKSAKLDVAPRLFKTNVGDIYTTNCVAADLIDDENTVIAAGTELYVGNDGYLTKTTNEGMVWKVVKGSDTWTMPDGQPAIKVQRIK